jgi:hypothetical protein
MHLPCHSVVAALHFGCVAVFVLPSKAQRCAVIGIAAHSISGQSGTAASSE